MTATDRTAFEWPAYQHDAFQFDFFFDAPDVALVLYEERMARVPEEKLMFTVPAEDRMLEVPAHDPNATVYPRIRRGN